jgi:hypothetical protein
MHSSTSLLKFTSINSINEFIYEIREQFYRIIHKHEGFTKEEITRLEKLYLIRANKSEMLLTRTRDEALHKALACGAKGIAIKDFVIDYGIFTKNIILKYNTF